MRGNEKRERGERRGKKEREGGEGKGNDPIFLGNPRKHRNI
jgi:hypothetical protein